MKKITFLLILLISSVGFSQPTTNAPNPTNNPADVISVYGGVFTNVATNYNPNWGQSGFATVNPTFDPGSGNLVLAYPNFNYQGTELTSQNASGMEFLHIDIWTSTATDVKVSPINNGTGAGEFLVNVPLVQGSWSSVNLPKSAFTGMTWNSIFQMKFDGQGGTTPSTIYLDNIYFWKTPVAAGTDASLSDLKIGGTTIAGFASNVINYTNGIPFGSPVPQITAATTTDTGATKVITQATSVPGNATVVVTSQNGSVSKTYTVSYIFTGPQTAAPTPPNRNAFDVVSLFSNTYANITVDAWSAPWDDSSVSDVQIAGNDTKKITFNNFLGIDFSSTGNHLDLSLMTRFHMDIFTETPSVIGKVFNSKIIQFGGTMAEVSAGELNINDGTTPAIVSGSWISIDVPMTIGPWSNNITRNDIAQFVITSNLGSVYFDNMYFYKGTALGVNDFSKSNVIIYPNPSKNVLNISSDLQIENVTIYNTLGQNVFGKPLNTNQSSIDVSSLSNGVYILTAQIGNELVRKQFIKN